MAQRKTFLLRVPPELHAALEKWADDELRSVNGQIEFLLATAVKKAGRVVPKHQPGDEPNEGDPPAGPDPPEES